MLAKLRNKKNRLQVAKFETDTDVEFISRMENLRNNFSEISIFDTELGKTNLNDWDQVKQMEKPALFDIIWNNIEEHRQPDFIVRIGFVNFKCCSLVLRCYTKSFAVSNGVECDFQTVESKMTSLSFMKLYNWMLNDEVTITQKDILDLICAAEELDIEELKSQCWLVLDNSNIYCEHVAFELYKDAKRFGVHCLCQLMLTRVCKFFLSMVAMEDFLRMDSDEVCHWLNSNSLGVNSEMEVFYAAVLWLNSKWCERKGKPLKKVMSCIRFGLVPPWFLVTLNAKTKCSDVNRVIRHSKVKRLIADGLSLTTTMLFYSKNTQGYEEFLRRSNLKIPVQRKWIIDSSCRYHYCEGSQILQHIDYEAFVDYLQSLRSFSKNYWESLEMAPESHWSYVFSIRPNCINLDLKD